MKHYKRVPKQRCITFILSVFILLIMMVPGNQVEAKAKTYTISTKTEPCDESIKYTTYNKDTKHYYTILSYLKKLETEGGGTLKLKKGTYTISNTLYVPSNVTIILNDGVTIKKGKKTGTKKFSASRSIFQFCGYSKSSKKGVYKKYNGESNISLIGKGNAVIDLNYDLDTIGIMMGHNSNVSISGITFQNMYSGHFIELDASKDVTISECTFKKHKDSSKNNKEAVNLDTPDRETDGFHADWSSYDKTANKNVTIKDCTFIDLERAIGTHKYSQGKLHTNIQLLNNNIKNCDLDAIRIMNWKNPVIEGNVIKNVANKKAGLRAILISGVTDPVITGNTFKDVSRPIQIMPWKNSGAGSKYDIIYNTISDSCLEQMTNNCVENVDETFIRFNKTYNEFAKDTVKIELQK